MTFETVVTRDTLQSIAIQLHANTHTFLWLCKYILHYSRKLLILAAHSSKSFCQSYFCDGTVRVDKRMLPPQVRVLHDLSNYGVVCFVVKGRKSQVHLRLTVIWCLFHRVSGMLHLHSNYDSLAVQTVNFVVMQICIADN